MIKNVLTIAGSDPSGGAGIQADLKTFSALGVYGMSVITGLTAQNTQGVTRVMAVPADMVIAQLATLFDDIDISSIKIGMLANKYIIQAIADFLPTRFSGFLVLDPVLISKSGYALVDKVAISTLRACLIPHIDLLTPNLPEAAALLGVDVAQNQQQMVEQGQALLHLGCKAVLMKGGHLNTTNESPDWLITQEKTYSFVLPRLAVGHTHGTGCTLSAAIAALHSHPSLDRCVGAAKDYLQEAIKQAGLLNVGRGIGPVHHFHQWWP